MTHTATSADGTTIAYDLVGDGPTLIVIGGAFNTRQSPGALVPLLAPHMRVVTYDRRGRVDSGDADAVGGVPPFAVEREIEDLAALIDAVGGEVFAYGHSSGAILGLEAASRGLPISRLAAYEPPYTADPSDSTPLTDGGVRAAIAADDREAAATAFMRLTGMPDQAIEGAKHAPFWPGLLAVAHTLPYDLALTGDGVVPATRLGSIAAEVLVMDGGASPAWAARAAEAVVKVVPGARRFTVAGQDHNVDPEVLAPHLIDFFS